MSSHQRCFARVSQSGAGTVSAPPYTSPNSILHIKRSSVPPPWTRYIEYAPDRQRWHVTYELHAVAYADDWPPTHPSHPRAYPAPFRILLHDRGSRTHTYACAGVSMCVADANDARQTFWFYTVGLGSLASIVFARYFREWFLYDQLRENWRERRLKTALVTFICYDDSLLSLLIIYIYI